jgi:hypothetical protein
VLFVTGRLPDAIAYNRRALAIFEELPRGFAAYLVRGLTNLAVATASSNDSTESAELFRRAIAIAESDLGPDHPLLAEVLTRYAHFLRSTKRSAEAHHLEQRAKQIQTRSSRENSLGYTIDVNALVANSPRQHR